MVPSGIQFTDLVHGIINKLRKVSGYRANMQNSMIFLYTSNKSENKIQLFKIIIKYLGQI